MAAINSALVVIWFSSLLAALAVLRAHFVRRFARWLTSFAASFRLALLAALAAPRCFAGSLAPLRFAVPLTVPRAYSAFCTRAMRHST